MNKELLYGRVGSSMQQFLLCLQYLGNCKSGISGNEFEQYIQKFRSKTFLIRCIFVYIAQTLTLKKEFRKCLLQYLVIAKV